MKIQLFLQVFGALPEVPALCDYKQRYQEGDVLHSQQQCGGCVSRRCFQPSRLHLQRVNAELFSKRGQEREEYRAIKLSEEEKEERLAEIQSATSE